MAPSTAFKTFSVVMGLVAASGGDSPAKTKCVGKHVYSGANLVSVAAGAPSGTTFCIHQGNYSVSQAVVVQSGERFVGVYRDPRPTVKITSAFRILKAEGSNQAIIRDLRIEGAIGNQPFQPWCGRGISGGANFTVVNARLTNKNQGIGSAEGGLSVKNSEIDHHGSSPFAQQTNRETAAGVISDSASRRAETLL